MTNNLINGSLCLATLVPFCGMATAEFGLTQFLEAVQSGASVAAVMGIFLWREVKKNEKLESRLDDANRKMAQQCENCALAKRAREMMIESTDDKDE